MKFISSAILSLFLALAFASTANAEILLFLGEGCGHCEEVEKFIEENALDESLEIQLYEVYNNEENKKLYDSLSKELGYMGDRVPLLIDGEIFVDGKDNVMNYLMGDEEKEVETSPEEDSKELNEIINAETEEEGGISNEEIIGIIIILIGISLYIKVLHSVKKLKR